MRWLIMGLLMGMMLMGSVSAVEWTDGCKARCENGRCNTVIGQTVWANDTDNRCKPIQEAKSLKKTFSVTYLEDDGVNGLEVVDFNYSCITLKPYAKDVFNYKFGQSIPLKVDGIVTGNMKIPGPLSTLTEVTLCSGETVSHNYSFGEKSTTIMIKNNITGTLGDSYLNQSENNTNYGSNTSIQTQSYSSSRNIRGAINFNTSSVPAGSAIITSYMYLYNDGSASYSRSIQAYNTTNGWDEATVTWNNVPALGTLQNTVTNAATSPGYKTWNITNATKSSFQSGLNNISIIIKDETESDSTKRTHKFWSTEGSGSSFPYINITYEAADTTPPTYSQNSTSSTYNGTAILHNLAWQDVTRLSGCIFSFDNCTGTLANDSWIAVAGTSNSTNITKSSNITVGCTIRWAVTCNDTLNNWNYTSWDSPFSYVTTEAPAPPETCWTQASTDILIPNGCDYLMVVGEGLL